MAGNTDLRILVIDKSSEWRYSQSTLYRICEGLKALGARLYLISSTRSKVIEAFRDLAIPMNTTFFEDIPASLQEARQWQHLKNSFVFTRGLNKIAKRFKPNVVLVNGLDTLALCLPFLKWQNLHYLTIANGPVVMQPSLLARVMQWGEGIIVPTQFEKHRLMRINPAASRKIGVIPIAIDEPRRFSFSLPSQNGAASWMTRFTYIGPLSSSSGLETLIQSCKIIRETTPGFLLTIAGSGREKKKLQALAEQEGVENFVNFAGIPSNPSELLRETDFLVLPHMTFQDPMVLFLGLFSGIPVIASSATAAADHARRYEIQLFTPGRKQELAARMLYASQNAGELRGQAQMRIQRAWDDFSPKKEARAYYNLLIERTAWF